MAKIILASASAARKAVLAGAGVAFEAIPAKVDERAVEAPLLAAGRSPAEVAEALAEAKALAIDAPGALVIGADQTLDLDGARFVKPESMAAARDQIEALSGRTHRLHSGLAGARDGRIVWRHVGTAALTMRALSPDEIDAYLARVGDAVLGSVGAYQVEGPGIQLFEAIEGDTFTILGLPLLPLLKWLRAEGALS